MSRIDSTENRFDNNIGSIFGDFKLPGALEVEAQDGVEDAEIVQGIPAELIKEISGKDESEETEEVEDTKIEPEENEDVIEDQNDTKQDLEINTDNSDDDNDDVDYSYKAIAQYLAEQGVIDYEDSDDIEDSPELLENVVLQTAKNMVEEYKESIPQEARDFLKYLEQGGDPSKYLQALSKPIDFDTLDLTNEDNQKMILREFLASQDYSREEIEDELKDYEDALILEKKAATAAKKLEKMYSKQKEQLLVEQEKAVEESKKQYTEYINTLKNTINNASSLGGLTIGPNDKREFEKYLLARDKEGLTQYEREVKENPIQTQLELAYLKFKKFDFSKVANQVKTQEARRIKNLIKSKDTTPKGSSKKISTSKGGDVSAFRNIGL